LKDGAKNNPQDDWLKRWEEKGCEKNATEHCILYFFGQGREKKKIPQQYC